MFNKKKFPVNFGYWKIHFKIKIGSTYQYFMPYHLNFMARMQCKIH